MELYEFVMKQPADTRYAKTEISYDAEGNFKAIIYDEINGKVVEDYQFDNVDEFDRFITERLQQMLLEDKA